MKNKKYWEEWAKKAGIRAVKTMAQVFVSTIGTTSLITGVDWAVVMSTTALAGVLSIATSIAGLPEMEELKKVKKVEEAEEVRTESE